MPQSETIIESAASAAPPSLAGIQRFPRRSRDSASAADSVQLRCRACGGLSPRFLSGCVECGAHMRGDAAEALLAAPVRNRMLASLVVLLSGAFLAWLVA